MVRERVSHLGVSSVPVRLQYCNLNGTGEFLGQLFDNHEFYQITYFQIDLTMKSAVKYMRSDVMYVGAKGL